MQITMATSAASPDMPNEDFAGVVPNAAVLLDGAGISGTEAICCHGVAWYTHRLGGALLGRLSRDDGQDLGTLLGDAIDEISDDHRETCDLADPSSPSATVAIFRLDGDRADYLVLGDSVLVLEQIGDEPLVVADQREVTLARPYRAAMAAVLDDTPEHRKARSELIDAFRAHRNQPGGFWVAKDDRRAASEALSGNRPIRDLASAALLSNGASRIVDRFGLADWPEVLALLDAEGPAEVIRRVRAAEANEQPRRDTHDDATIVLIRNVFNQLH